MVREMWNDVSYRVRALVRRGDTERELNAEIEDHLAREAEALERAGRSPAEALREARLAFGGLDEVKERTRDACGTALIERGTNRSRQSFERCGTQLRIVAASVRRRPVDRRTDDPAERLAE
jgi:hypothetical protein